MHQIKLHYGYQECEDGIYHAFETSDIEECADSREVAARLAGLLDCTPNDESFNWNSMYVALPAEGYAAGRVGVLAQMIEGPWNNDACKGYAIMAMKRAGLDAETIGKVSDAMTDCFDDTTVAEAGRYYVKGAVR